MMTATIVTILALIGVPLLAITIGEFADMKKKVDELYRWKKWLEQEEAKRDFMKKFAKV